MLIEGRHYKISIIILLMQNEIDATIQTVETLLEGIEDSVTISILLNGGNNSELRKLFERFDCIKYYESQVNLGVAGGRNFLLRTTECQNSDVIMILDNDVIPPKDYIKNLTMFLIGQKDAGVVGASVANIKYLPYKLVVKHFCYKGFFGNKIFKINSSDIKSYLVEDLLPEHIFHIGIHPNYYYAYFSSRPWFLKFVQLFLVFLRIKKNFSPLLKNNTTYLSYIKNGVSHYRVSNVAGCSQAFKREIIDDIGFLNEIFNPYGHEDSEFCVRATRFGYTNYIDTNTWLFHGTDTRHQKRDPGVSNEIRFKGLTLFAALTFIKPFRYRVVIIKLIVAEFLFEALKNPLEAIQRMKFKFAGYRKALEKLERK